MSGTIRRISAAVFKTLAAELSAAPERTNLEALPNLANPNYTGGGQLDAAKTTGLTADWNLFTQTINGNIFGALRIVRDRARNLMLNDAFARHGMTIHRSMIVGPHGVQLQVNANDSGEPDEIANELIENAWKDFCHAENFSLDGNMSAIEFQMLLRYYRFRDGEVFIRIHNRNDAKYGVQLSILEPEWIPETYNVQLDNGNSIVMGVEMTPERKRVAYWVVKNTPQSDLWGYTFSTADMDRVPAEEVVHLFAKEYYHQVRGISELITAMNCAHMLNGYDQAAVAYARAAACQMFWLKEDAEGGTAIDSFANGRNKEGKPVFEIAPLGINKLPKGWDFAAYKPIEPNSEHAGFDKTILHRMTAGMEVPYPDGGNDYEGVNYSSGRLAREMANRNWHSIQLQEIEHLWRPLYANRWLKRAMLGGIKYPSQKLLPFSKLAKFAEHIWIPQPFPQIDPEKETTAERLASESLFISPRESARKRGKDLRILLREISQDRELMGQYGLVPVYATRSTETQAEAPSTPQTGDKGAELAVQQIKEYLAALPLDDKLWAELSKKYADQPHNGNGNSRH